MSSRVGVFGVGLCLLLTGCVPGQDMQQLVSNPFGQPPDVPVTTSMYPPSVNAEMAKRVLCIGDQIVKANPELNLHPLFPFLATDSPEIFHRGRELYTTEGLIKRCDSDAQIAAVLCVELGKMVAERESLALPETRQPERRPPIDVPVGNDSGGVFGASDGTRRVELAKFEHDNQSRNVTIPPPSPDLLTRRILQKAGYTLEDLDAVRPLLLQSDQNGTWRRQLVHGVY